jgi:hypothetical protein
MGQTGVASSLDDLGGDGSVRGGLRQRGSEVWWRLGFGAQFEQNLVGRLPFIGVFSP